MGKLIIFSAPSGSGKSTIINYLLTQNLNLAFSISATSRPPRGTEQDGVEYFFVDQERFDEMMDEEKIIEFRSYNTKCGIWTYFTADDGQIELWQYDYLVIGTIESYCALKERAQTKPQYAELCRRFLADAEDFSEENLERVGIKRRFQNIDKETCMEEILREINVNL